MSDKLPREGEDDFGEYSFVIEPCDICKATGMLGLQYFNKPRLPAGIKLKDTIHKIYPRVIGVSCGCYAKFHRQVAHIQDAMKSSKRS